MLLHWTLYSEHAGLSYIPQSEPTHTHTHRTIPQFVWHRQNWNIVYPQLSLDHAGEMEELAKHGTYVAGFLDPSVQGKTELYDLFVNGEMHRYLMWCDI